MDHCDNSVDGLVVNPYGCHEFEAVSRIEPVMPKQNSAPVLTDDEFEIDALEMKITGLAAIAKAIRGADFKEKSEQVTDAALPLVDEAVDADNYEVATQLVDLAMNSARKAKNFPRLKELAARKDEDNGKSLWPGAAAYRLKWWIG